MINVWKPHWQHEKVSEKRCRASVYADRAGSHQCSRKGVVEEDGYLWCKQHAPSAEKKRREEREAAWKREVQARTRGYKRQAAWDAVAKAGIAVSKGAATMPELDAAVAAYENL